MKLVFAPDVPTRVESRVRELVAKFSRYLPKWVYAISVTWDGEDTCNFARMSPDEAYRRICLTITPSFMLETEEEQCDTILHEILHSYNAPIGDIANEILDMLCPVGSESSDITVKALYEVMETRINDAVEKANADLIELVNSLASDNEKRPNNVIFPRQNVRPFLG